jgi:hypothetical protein
MWAFVGGTDTFNNAGSYGTPGVASSANLPPSKLNAAFSFDDINRKLYVQGGFKTPTTVTNDIWVFTDNLPEQQLVEYNSEEEITFLASNTLAVKTRTNFGNEEASYIVEKASLSIGAIIGISAGVAFIFVIGVLFLLVIIKRQSYKEAALAELGKNSTVESSVIDESSIDAGGGPKRPQKLGSSTLDLSIVKTPSPSVTYPADSVATAKSSLPDSLKLTGYDFDAVLQIGTQNGAVLYNGLSVASTLKSLSDKVTIKVFGRDITSLQPGVADAFWEEAALIYKLFANPSSRGTTLLGYCLEPVALIFPSYPIGFLEQYLTQQQLSETDVFNIVYDLVKALNVLHTNLYAHRNIKLRTIFLEKEKKLHAVLTSFNSLVKAETDAKAKKAFSVYRIDAKAANFVAPEVFLALKGQPPTLNAAQALKSGDLFSLGILISKLLRSIK